MQSKRIYLIALVAAVVIIAVVVLVIVRSSSVTLSVSGMPDVIVSGEAFEMGAKLVLIYGNGKTVELFLDKGMFSKGELEKLETAGTHTVSGVYSGKEFSFTVTVLDGGVFAFEEYLCRYVDAESVAVCGFLGKERAVIPQTVNGKSVALIDKNAFKGSLVEYVWLPSSVTEIADGAFSDCVHIEYFYIPHTVKKLGNGIFNCNGSSSLRVVEIDNPDISCNIKAFSGCPLAEMVFYVKEQGSLYNLLSKPVSVGNMTVELNVNTSPEKTQGEKNGQLNCLETQSSGEKRVLPYTQAEAVEVSNSHKIVWALALGKRPVAVTDRARLVIEKAEQAVCESTHSSMSQTEKVFAFFDYICKTTTNDATVADMTVANHTSFMADGVFIDGFAVCDGYAKAFFVMCAMEGITCERVTGYYDGGYGRVYHAWNRVFVGGVWYDVDVSKGDTFSSVLGEECTVHYFCMTSAEISGNVAENHTDKAPGKVYGFYAERNCEINSYEELVAFLKVNKSAVEQKQVFEVLINMEFSLENPFITQLNNACRDAGIERGIFPVAVASDGNSDAKVYLLI